MNEEKIRFIDLFSGIGGFRQGLERAGGFQCVWSCDNNKYSNQVYTKQFGKTHHYAGDIRGVDPRDIPNFDLLCAGFPCQAFSVAGKRQGFQDTRGTLFFEICRIAEAKRPSLLLLENVKGLLNHDRGRTFTVILQTLDELGYWIEWQVLNSKHHGIPQNRERVFIIGHLTGAKGSGQEIFPIGKIHKDSPKRTQFKKRRQIGATLSGRSAGGGNARGNYVLTLREEATAIDSNYWKGPDQHDQRTIMVDFFNKSVREDKNFNTLKTSQRSASSSAVVAVLTPDRKDKRQHGRRFKEEGEPIFTLTGQDVHGVRDIKSLNLRRLTPIECERLQGFPDNWTEGVSDSQRYMALGNAVTVNVIEFLGKQIKRKW